MKQLYPTCLSIVLAAGTVVHGGPVEDAIVAVVRLSEQPSYSWTSTVSDDARTYEVSGKTRQTGYTWMRMPMINSIRRKLGRSVTDTDIELIFHGNVDCVILTEEGWKRPDEIPEPWEHDDGVQHVVTHRGTLGAGGGRSVVRSSSVRAARARRSAAERKPYSNLQLGASRPHEELGVIVSSHASFEVHDDTVSGKLTDIGAQLLLVRDGQEEITPIRASGSFTLWLEDGMVARYRLQLEGVLSVETRKGRTHVAVQQTSTTQLKDVGTTQFEVPAEAKIKLGN